MPEQTSTAQAAQGEQQLIHHSVQYLQKYLQETYGNVKAMTPAVIQNSLATIEGLQAVNTLTGQLERVITSLDHRLDGVMQNLEISNLSDLKSKAGKLQEDTVTNFKCKAANITENLTTRAAVIKTDLETRVSAAKTGLETKVVEWKSVRGDLSKKTVQRLQNGFSSVKQFTSEQTASLLHVDLIQYAHEVLDNAQSTVKPTFDILNEKVAAGIVTVNQSISSLQEIAVEKSKQGLEQAEALRTELRTRLQKAIAVSRELSQHSAEYVLVHYQKIKSMDREQVKATLHDAVQYILDAPSHFAKLSLLEQHDLSTANALQHINRLLVSLKEVLVPPKLAKHAEEKECKDESAKLEDEKTN